MITPFPALQGGRPGAWIAIAADPTPDPSASVDPSPAPTIDPQVSPLPSATPDPGQTPDPTPSDSPAPPSPTPDPTATPAAPTDTPAPSPAASPTVEPSPSASASAEPSASAAPVTILYELSPGQQSGSLIGEAIPIYRLVLPDVGAEANSPHGGTAQYGSDCAACHAAHRSQQADLISSSADANVCFACHAAGLGGADVAAEFSRVPANDPTSDSYYSHPVSTAIDGPVTCASCHNPHLSGTDRPQQSTTGWTVDGATAAARGVAVTNGVIAGSVPIYTPITHGLATYEYELCLNCHSGSAPVNLPARDAAHPSWWALDAGIEFNPANASYHPIEAVGRNASAQMAASLAGTSPFKAWSFSVDSTIRCTSCHGDSSTVNQTGSSTPLTPAPDAIEASHASPNRGLLIAPYRDRLLKPAGEAYQPEDFALCYLCHAERPFADPNIDPSAPDTAFPLHGAHMTSIAGPGGASLSIDTAGAGQGLAICSECHFRSHSTAIAYQPGDAAPVARSTGYTGLVDFSPNVEGLGADPPLWSAPDGSGTGSCALTCHGYTHTTSTYTVAPATGFIAAPTTGPAGLTVHFTDATRYATSDTATWAWDFGDGTMSSAQNPPGHTYTVPGTYTVTLTVTRTGDGLSTTMTRASYITVQP